MRRLVLAVLLLLVPLNPGAALAQENAQDQAMTSLLLVCQGHANGDSVATLVERARGGGFLRDPDKGGILGETLTWEKGGRQVRIHLWRAQAERPQTCRIEIDHGLVDTAALAKEVGDWALATRPPYAVADIPADPLASMFGPRPTVRTVFRRPGERLIVEQFNPPGPDASLMDMAHAVTITLEIR